ncbi:diacylglycerol kinase (ATP) [Sarracenia purpurea var. burkii]
MDSPGSYASRTTTRSSVIESFRGCTMAGARIPKEDLRRKITMPPYLRRAMRDAIESKDITAGNRHYTAATATGDAATATGDAATATGAAATATGAAAKPSESPMVVFINARSGGRHGPELKDRLQDLMGEEQVFDLQFVKPHEFTQYGLGCLEKLAELGDTCAKETRGKLRVVVAGGDGTVGWVLGCLGELHKQEREPVPPTAIIPLGTGNDLSRSFGWGGSFPFNWRSAIKRTLDRAGTCPTSRLDR